jgi:V/A-type H+-transporting ATPase subunit B
MGVKHDVADFFRQSFSESGALTRVAMFLNLADDPPVKGLVMPRAPWRRSADIGCNAGDPD